MSEIGNSGDATGIYNVRSKLLQVLVSSQKLMAEQRKIFDEIAALTLQVNAIISEETRSEPGSSSGPGTGPFSSPLPPVPALFVPKFGATVPPPLPLSFAPFPDVARPLAMYSQVVSVNSQAMHQASVTTSVSGPRYAEPWSQAPEWVDVAKSGDAPKLSAPGTASLVSMAGGGGGSAGGAGFVPAPVQKGAGQGGAFSSASASPSTLCLPGKHGHGKTERFVRVVLDVLGRYRDIGIKMAKAKGVSFYAQFLVGQKIRDMIQKYEETNFSGQTSVLPPSPARDSSYTGPTFVQMLMEVPGIIQSTMVRKKKVVDCFAFDPQACV